MAELPEFRPGEVILELKNDTVDLSSSNPDQYVQSLVEMMRHFKSENGLAKVESLYPTDTALFQSALGNGFIGADGGNPETPSAPVARIDDQKNSPDQEPDWRLRLRLRVDRKSDIDALVKKASAHLGVTIAERIPYRWLPLFNPQLPPDDDAPPEPKPDMKRTAAIRKPREGVPQLPPPKAARWAQSIIDLPPSWRKLKLSNIAVLDSGCDQTHPALSNAVAYGTSESRTDLSGHGTAICGILAARGTQTPVQRDRIYDVLDGVLPQSSLWVVNIMERKPVMNLGRKFFAVDPRRYALALRRIALSSTIRVVNLSIGGRSGTYTAEGRDLAALEKAGIVVVAASGNTAQENTMERVFFPAGYSNVIAVGAMKFGSRSLWGRSAMYDKQSNLLVAPGDGILTTIPMRSSNRQGLVFSGWHEGTSMAAPFVTAVVAALCDEHPEDTPVQIRERLATDCTTLLGDKWKWHALDYRASK